MTRARWDPHDSHTTRRRLAGAAIVAVCTGLLCLLATEVRPDVERWADFYALPPTPCPAPLVVTEVPRAR